MKSILAASIALLATITAATPIAPRWADPTVQFTNDQSGANTNVVVTLGVPHDVSVLLDNTVLDNNGVFLATSFFLQANFQGVTCDLNVAGTHVIISEQRTFAHIASPPVDLAGASIICNHW